MDLGGRALLLRALPVLLALAAHGRALFHPFVYDDVATVLGNPALRAPLDFTAIALQERFRPLTSLSYGLDRLAWGFDPRGYHLSGLLLHLLNVWLVFELGLRLARRAAHPRPEHAAFAGASLFAAHPLLVEALGYVSARAELLAAAFGLAALVAWLDAPSRPLLAGLLVLPALASKETGLVVPLLLAAAHLLLPGAAPPPSAPARRLPAVLVGLGVAAVVLLLLRLWAHLDLERTTLLRSPWQNLLMEFGVVWRYLRLLVLPLGQSLVHAVEPVTRPTDPRALLLGAGLLGLLLLALRLRRRLPLLALGSVWFLLLLAPSSSLVPLAEPMAEHRVYFAAIGLLIAAGGSLAASPRPLVNGALFAAVLVPLFALTQRRHEVWASAVTLWADAARKAPRVWIARYGHADALRDAGRLEDAAAAYDEAIRVLPGEPRAWINLAQVLAAQGRLEEAEQVLAAAPDSPLVKRNRERLRWLIATGASEVPLR